MKYLSSTNSVTASIYNSYNSVINYFELTKVNKELAEENARLRTRLSSSSYHVFQPEVVTDSVVKADSVLFKFISARILNNSVNKQFNYILLDKGSKDGIKPDQGIISPDGVAGVVINVSKSYALGLSLLNQRWSISAKLKKSDFFGSLVWDGIDYRYANLHEIPFHVNVAVGDTVVTSGYSSIFPEGINIGTIQSYEQPGGENYYNISVKLSTNFKALTYVDVIENTGRSEIDDLEKQMQNDLENN